MIGRNAICGLLAGLALAAFGAPKASAGAAGSFRKPPAAAVKALKATVGKPFTAGWVFVDGRYVPPPYKVERHGTVLRINGIQITGEVVPWESFIKTQEGVTVTRREPEPEEESPVPEEPAEDEPTDEDFDIFADDDEMSLDDLFDDEPEPKKSAAKTPAKKAKPKPKKPTVTYSFDGEFVHNDRTRAMLDKINRERTRIDKLLRGGGYICCGTRYAMLTGDEGAAKSFVTKLPDIMRKNSDRDSFANAVRAARLTFLPRALIGDLHANRYSYPQIQNRLREEAEAKKW